MDPDVEVEPPPQPADEFDGSSRFSNTENCIRLSVQLRLVEREARLPEQAAAAPALVEWCLGRAWWRYV